MGLSHIASSVEPVYVLGMATMAWQAQSAFSRKFHMNDEMLKLKYRAHNAYVLQVSLVTLSSNRRTGGAPSHTITP